MGRKESAECSATEDWFDDLLAGVSPSAATEKENDPLQPRRATSTSLFDNDYEWACAGLETLKSNQVPISVERDDSIKQINLSIPEDLDRRFAKLPPEIKSSETGLLSLTTDREAINREIKRCRAEEGAWPRLHLLWEQHPALRWMQDKLLSKFGRNQAACIHLRHLTIGEHIVLGNGIIPNRKGQPLIQRWYGVRFQDGKLQGVLELDAVIERTRFREDHANDDSIDYNFASIQSLFPGAVDQISEKLSEARSEFIENTRPVLDRELEKLREFLDKRTEQLEFDFAKSIDKGLSSTKEYRLQKKEQERREIEKKHDDYKKWIVDTMESEDAASILLLAVFGNFSQK